MADNQHIYRQRTIEVNLNRPTYCFMRKLALRIVNYGAVIFGGAPRDFYIHNHYAKLFEELAAPRTETQLANGMEDGYYEFSDPNDLPGTAHRLLIPRDLDIFIKGDEDEANKFLAYLDQLGYDVEALTVDAIA